MGLDEIRDRATLTVEEAAELLGVGRSCAYDATRRGDIPAVRPGRRLVVPIPALIRLLEQPVGDQQPA
ncbi:MAG: helix-turn-helix domain-containing protein [Actinobacteria bacterium]|nr:helix-turn-helix domain-containing protein [Actinomycetota bacterium]